VDALAVVCLGLARAAAFLVPLGEAFLADGFLVVVAFLVVGFLVVDADLAVADLAFGCGLVLPLAFAGAVFLVAGFVAAVFETFLAILSVALCSLASSLS
jgi:hypothetical protein